MNLLHVISSCNPSSGGPIEGVKIMYKHFKKVGINPEILCSDSPKKIFTKNKDLPKIYAVGPGLFNYKYNPSLKSWLYKNIEKYDCVIIHGLWQYHNYAVWKVATERKIPYYIFYHGMLDPWFNKGNIFKYLKKKIYWNLIQHKIIKNAKSALFTSTQEKYLARKSFKPYKVKEKLAGYGTSGNPYHYNIKNNLFFKKYPKLKKKKLIIFFGRIHPKKGVDLLIEAFQEVFKEDSKYHLVIAGPYQKKYYEYLNKCFANHSNKLKNFTTWTGPIYNKLKWDFLKSCYFFCLPSHQENFGISITEAMASKKPVMITDKINIYKVIKKYKAGFVNNDDLKGVILNLKKIRELNKIKYKKMCKSSYDCYMGNFNMKNNIEKTINIIRKS